MKLQDLQLYQENNKYYLSATINYEDKNGFYEMSIPKIRLPISRDRNCEVNIISGYDDWDKPQNTVNVDFGFGRLYAEPFDDQFHRLTITCLEEKVHQMTLAEIEKELGYKIELKKEN